jgi:Co/Zn/Cd efflux system component
MDGMEGCCDVVATGSRLLHGRQRRVLRTVLAINAAMFLVEFGAGVLAHSTALLADSLDMLGDALVYAFSLYVVGRGARWQAGAALLKGTIMATFGIAAVVEVIVNAVRRVVPAADVIGGIGLLALAANLTCLALLLAHRRDDLNLRSTWLCSRNDVIANVGVLVAAGGVALTASAWPDVAVGAVIATVFAGSAVGVLRDARRQLRSASTLGSTA